MWIWLFCAICISIILYADDVLLLAPSVSSLQLILSVCEKELHRLDMMINVKKSLCLRIGSRYNAKCSNIIASDSNIISWSNAIGYLGVNIVADHKFACSLDNSKKSFYRAFNAIFAKVGQIASEDVISELFKAKCLPALYYGSEACPLNKSQIRSLEYVLNNTFRKIFATKSFDVATDCVLYFGCAVQDTLCSRKSKLLTKLRHKTTSNLLYHAVQKVASDELAELQKLM